MSNQQATPTNATEVLERIARSMRFADKADAVAYIAEVAQDGFYPAATTVEGITEYHDSTATTYGVRVEQQTYNGVVTPRYRNGQRVIARPLGMGWEAPIMGTLTYVYGHDVKVELDGGGRLSCMDYEVDPA